MENRNHGKREFSCRVKAARISCFWRKTLPRKMIGFLFLGFIAASAVFFLIFGLGNALLDDYFLRSDFIYKAEKSYIEDFCRYVKKEELATTDLSQLREWSNKKGIERLTISRERILLYDSSYADDVIWGQATADFLHYNWQYFYTVPFADGNADVYIDANYKSRYYITFCIVCVLSAALVWVFIFVQGVRKEVKYIQQLCVGVRQIELGFRDLEVPQKGMDELGQLAHGLNQMRLTLIEKEKTEQEMKEAQDQLVLSMSHDLRTPLTGLMAFLDIARQQQNVEMCIAYINKAYVKSTQIRDLSNRLFEFFLASSSQPLKLEQPEDAEYALGEYLSELCALLETAGFCTSIDKIFWLPVQIRISTDYVGRIIDNLVSNIIKYADSTFPVELCSGYEGSYIHITVRNKSAQPGQHMQGTGIGVPNIHSMMEKIGGKCSVHSDADQYSITLSFQIIAAPSF